MVKPEPLVGLPALVKLPVRVAVLQTSLPVKLPLLVRHTVPLVLGPCGRVFGDPHIKTVHSPLALVAAALEAALLLASVTVL